MARPAEDVFETSSFASLIQQEEREEIIPLDLHTACLIGDYDSVRGFIERSENLDRTNCGGWTGLMYAAYVGRDNILNLLMEAGANIDVQSKNDGFTALMLASYCASESIIYFLIHHGASVNIRDSKGMTSLFHAVKQGHQGAVKLLAQSNADLNMSQTDTDKTPLMEAAISGYENIVSILLEHGADVNRRTKKGETLLSLARRYGNMLIVNAIEKHSQAFTGTPREEARLDHGESFDADAGSKVNISDGPTIIKRIQNNLSPGERPVAAVCSEYKKTSPYQNSTTNNAENFHSGEPNHLDMSGVASSLPDKDMSSVNVNPTNMESFNDRYANKKPPGRIATEPPKQLFKSHHSYEAQPLPKTLKEILEEYSLESSLLKFEQQGIDVSSFLELTDTDLKDMGFDKMGPRKRILLAISKCKERLKIYGTGSELSHTEQLEAKVQQLNAQLHEAVAYIKQQQLADQHYQHLYNYLEAEKHRMRQVVFNINDLAQNCKDALGYMKKIKEFTNYTVLLLQKLKDHPNFTNLSSELAVDSSYYGLASTVKGDIEMAWNRLDLSFKQIERTLIMAQINTPQTSHPQQPPQQ